MFRLLASKPPAPNANMMRGPAPAAAGAGAAAVMAGAAAAAPAAEPNGARQVISPDLKFQDCKIEHFAYPQFADAIIIKMFTVEDEVILCDGNGRGRVIRCNPALSGQLPRIASAIFAGEIDDCDVVFELLAEGALLCTDAKQRVLLDADHKEIASRDLKAGRVDTQGFKLINPTTYLFQLTLADNTRTLATIPKENVAALIARDVSDCKDLASLGLGIRRVDFYRAFRSSLDEVSPALFHHLVQGLHHFMLAGDDICFTVVKDNFFVVLDESKKYFLLYELRVIRQLSANASSGVGGAAAAEEVRTDVSEAAEEEEVQIELVFLSSCRLQRQVTSLSALDPGRFAVAYPAKDPFCPAIEIAIYDLNAILTQTVRKKFMGQPTSTHVFSDPRAASFTNVQFTNTGRTLCCVGPAYSVARYSRAANGAGVDMDDQDQKPSVVSGEEGTELANVVRIDTESQSTSLHQVYGEYAPISLAPNGSVYVVPMGSEQLCRYDYPWDLAWNRVLPARVREAFDGTTIGGLVSLVVEYVGIFATRRPIVSPAQIVVVENDVPVTNSLGARSTSFT
jgi:hypothetical protein